MEQLPLNIAPRLAYSPENFILHSGVENLHRSVMEILSSPRFGILFISASARTGKTHFSVRISDDLGLKGTFSRIVEGSKLAAWMESDDACHQWKEDEVLIVDDADHYLSGLNPGESGPLVALIEVLRVSRAKIVFLSAKELEAFTFDQHIKSRMLPGVGFSIAAPSSDEIQNLIQVMARQRGISLSERKADFLTRRLPRDIPSIEHYLEKLDHLSKVLGKSIKFPLLNDAI